MISIRIIPEHLGQEYYNNLFNWLPYGKLGTIKVPITPFYA